MGPSGIPTLYASEAPSIPPSAKPSGTEGDAPSMPPSSCPSMVPSEEPSEAPSASPSEIPSESPSASAVPSSTPTFFASDVPSVPPSLAPSMAESSAPSLVPTTCPSRLPSKLPSMQPSSGTPTFFESDVPSTPPSIAPSIGFSPTVVPTTCPSRSPSSTPTHSSLLPSAMRTAMPSSVPSAMRTAMPSAMPSAITNKLPSALPSAMLSALPVAAPSLLPSSLSNRLSSLPSSSPNSSSAPSRCPSPTPSSTPSSDSVTRRSLLGRKMTQAQGLAVSSSQKLLDSEQKELSCDRCDAVSNAKPFTKDWQYPGIMQSSASLADKQLHTKSCKDIAESATKSRVAVSPNKADTLYYLVDDTTDDLHRLSTLKLENGVWSYMGGYRNLKYDQSVWNEKIDVKVVEGGEGDQKFDIQARGDEVCIVWTDRTNIHSPSGKMTPLVYCFNESDQSWREMGFTSRIGHDSSIGDIELVLPSTCDCPELSDYYFVIVGNPAPVHNGEQSVESRAVVWFYSHKLPNWVGNHLVVRATMQVLSKVHH